MQQPTSGQLFRHVDGGIYRFVLEAKDTRDLTPLMVYQHEWPFEASAWARPKDEWVPTRFSPIEETDLVQARQEDRATAQARIGAAKAARRAAEGR